MYLLVQSGFEQKCILVAILCTCGECEKENLCHFCFSRSSCRILPSAISFRVNLNDCRQQVYKNYSIEILDPDIAQAMFQSNSLIE